MTLGEEPFIFPLKSPSLVTFRFKKPLTFLLGFHLPKGVCCLENFVPTIHLRQHCQGNFQISCCQGSGFPRRLMMSWLVKKNTSSMTSSKIYTPRFPKKFRNYDNYGHVSPLIVEYTMGTRTLGVHLIALPETNSSHLPGCAIPKRKLYSLPTNHFQGRAVSFREGTSKISRKKNIYG